MKECICREERERVEAKDGPVDNTCSQIGWFCALGDRRMVLVCSVDIFRSRRDETTREKGGDDCVEEETRMPIPKWTTN